MFHFVFVFHGFISRGRIKFCDVSQVLTVEVLVLELLLLGRQQAGNRKTKWEKKKYKRKRKIPPFISSPLVFLLNKLCMSHQLGLKSELDVCQSRSGNILYTDVCGMWQTGSQWKLKSSRVDPSCVCRHAMHERPTAFRWIDFFFSCLCPVTLLPPPND